MSSDPTHDHRNGYGIDRRGFLAGAAGTTAAFTVLRPQLVRGSEANAKIRLGMIGCGGRGNWIADLFAEHGGYELTACADYFKDRVDSFGDKHGIPSERRFISLSCYRELIDSGAVDAVAIMSPPYFHPQQADAAVEAGLHVYLAKPIAVDVPGCRTVEAAGRKASEAGQAFLVDFQTRADPYFMEAVRRTQEGAIGGYAFGESMYHANRLSVKAEPDGSPEHRLRNWVFYQDLSGDIITEQNIHTLDVMSWIMDQPPVRACGTGGRKVRTDVGDCWDHFVLTYEYPDGVGIGFSSRQFEGHGSQPAGIRNRMFGDRGVLETQYGGRVVIRGEDFYEGGATSGIFRDGAVANIATFHEMVRSGRSENETVAPSVRSNLVTILGRTAAYEGRPLSWDEMLERAITVEADLSGLEA